MRLDIARRIAGLGDDPFNGAWMSDGHSEHAGSIPGGFQMKRPDERRATPVLLHEHKFRRSFFSDDGARSIEQETEARGFIMVRQNHTNALAYLSLGKRSAQRIREGATGSSQDLPCACLLFKWATLSGRLY